MIEKRSLLHYVPLPSRRHLAPPIKLTETSLFPQVVSELTGKDLETLIKEGSEKLASVPSGGGAAPAAAAAAAPAAGGAAESKKEEKKEEEEEEDEDMGFGLFD